MSASRNLSSMPPKRKGPPSVLSLELPSQHHVSLVPVGESSNSASPSPLSTSSKPRSLRNMKNLSLNLPSAQSSTSSLSIPPVDLSEKQTTRLRRPSIASLPPPSAHTAALMHNKEVGKDGEVPYADGPIQIVPGIWLGSEDNARDWKGLLECGIKSILNVAKEVSSPFDTVPSSSLRPSVSTPNFKNKENKPPSATPTYHPPHIPSGRPGMHYLKLQWSHGQHDLVERGFSEAFDFVDQALARGEGILVHCQCGISRSATLVIAIVMRAAAERSSSVPSEIWALKDKGMQGAYSFVKSKSKWAGPNMSLIYQLMDYERKLRGFSAEDSDADEEWGRQRRLMEDMPSDDDSFFEAQALDKAMEDRILARKSSTSSFASTSTGAASELWKRRMSRKRTPSVTSSMLSEELVEEDEEGPLLGIGEGFERSESNSPEDIMPSCVSRPPSRSDLPPPSAPIWKTSFSTLPPMPATAARATFDIPPPGRKNFKKRPAPLLTSKLPPVPSSPVNIITTNSSDDESNSISDASSSVQSRATSTSSKRKGTSAHSPTMVRPRRDARPPPLKLRSSVLRKAQANSSSTVSTPSQTLFVFPASPTATRTPSTMTLNTMSNSIPFPGSSTPRVSTFKTAHGRTRSFIGLGVPPTPTTAFSKVDARGWVVAP